jgi:hypothetical protein
VLGCLFLAFATLGTPTAASAQACGTLKKHPKGGYQHVIWIWMENHNYDQIIGSADAPYTNSIATQCGLATDFHNLTHVSLGNYIGAVTGLPLLDSTTHQDLQPFLRDCIVEGPTGACATSAASIFERVPSWKAYMESMTTNCQATGLVGYAVRHNPPPFLTNLAATCPTFDVPYTALQADLDADTLPAFAFVSPDTVSDGHDGGDPISIVTGDAWLSAELPKILDSAAYKSGKTVIFLTWDEGEATVDDLINGGAIGRDCSADKTHADCHIATIVISPFTKPGTQYGKKPFNHYSMLRTTEELLKIKKKNWVGLSTKAKSMKSAFHL